MKWDKIQVNKSNNPQIEKFIKYLNSTYLGEAAKFKIDEWNHLIMKDPAQIIV